MFSILEIHYPDEPPRSDGIYIPMTIICKYSICLNHVIVLKHPAPDMAGSIFNNNPLL